ncbi:MAG TPA: NAD(P)/FAD-dependent oxidoreductase [Verrucomicrobiae bacterium]|nr:NAD(P)/FAD-dependent oxidoreductase [Verrucomicrobiae bacterium]
MAAPSIAIIGAGFSGLGMAYYLRQAGIDRFTIYEKASSLGGVWRENTYPGAACDVQSHLYSFSFDPHYPWSKAYGPQAEILDYIRQLSRKYDLDRHILYGHEVTGADYDEARSVWVVRFSDGTQVEAQVLITGVGQLHRPSYPRVPGIERFKGRTFHSAQWDHSYDLKGKIVASIGTGPSAIQYVPEIAKVVKQLHVFQRSPAWCVRKTDRVYTAPERWLLNHWPWTHTLDRLRIFWWVEFVASVIQKSSVFHWFSRRVVQWMHRSLLDEQVKDPVLKAKLTPDFPVGCKRLLFSNEWFSTLAQGHVELVTDEAVAIDEAGIVTADGKHRAVDCIVYGTGFTATQFLAPMEFRGRGGVSLRERWKGGADAYFGVGCAGFPNFFMLYGPNTNLGIGTILFMLERQQRYVVQCIELLRDRKLRSLDVQAEAQARYNRELVERGTQLVYLDGCNSWYLENGRNTQNWVGYMTEYGRRMKRPNIADYALEPA